MEKDLSINLWPPYSMHTRTHTHHLLTCTIPAHTMDIPYTVPIYKKWTDKVPGSQPSAVTRQLTPPNAQNPRILKTELVFISHCISGAEVKGTYVLSSENKSQRSVRQNKTKQKQQNTQGLKFSALLSQGKEEGRRRETQCSCP